MPAVAPFESLSWGSVEKVATGAPVVVLTVAVDVLVEEKIEEEVVKVVDVDDTELLVVELVEVVDAVVMGASF